MILFKSVLLCLDRHRSYTETELDEALQRWGADVGRSLGIDHVSLRRYLVDHRFLRRDAYGRSYMPQPAAGEELFEPAVNAVDPARVIEETRRVREARRREYS